MRKLRGEIFGGGEQIWVELGEEEEKKRSGKLLRVGVWAEANIPSKYE